MKIFKTFLVFVLLASMAFVGCKKEDKNPSLVSSSVNVSSLTSESSSIKKEYTVTFVSNGGTAVNPITQEEGSTVNKPTDPVLDGSKFIAWCTDEELTKEVSWPLTLTGNITLYAKFNVLINIKGLLTELLTGYQVSPLSYVPETMQANYTSNLIDKSKIVTNFSSGFVNLSSLCFGGFGEQWNMVLENIEQSQTFYETLSIIDGISTVAVAGFNNYVDSNPASTANYTTKVGDYNVTIDFDGQTISFVVDYSISAIEAQISLTMDIFTKNKEVRIQLSDANALKYIIKENSYEFAIRYLGVRRAYFSVARGGNGDIEGHIVEYVSLEDSTLTNSSADFYIGDDYVTCVGNKAGGLIGFTGTICEVYNVTTGKMVGYEVRESLAGIQYNTLWFNLSDINGIVNIKTDTKEEIYLNNSSTALVSKKVGGLIIINPKAESRRFDIEFRTQYFYSYDSTTQSYEKIALEVPMLFVQEEYFDSLSLDVKGENSYLDIVLNVPANNVTKITSDYANLVDVFIENKESFKTEEDILTFIGTKFIFD